MDMNQRAHRTVLIATGQMEKSFASAKAAGGHAAAASMTPKQRSERAKKAAKARWEKDD